jgi:hypothetical protein
MNESCLSCCPSERIAKKQSAQKSLYANQIGAQKQNLSDLK